MDERANPNRSQGELAYEKLDSAIRSGLFKPGDRVREVDISERLGLSRTPVREALRRLEAEGIIEHRPRQGAVIRSLTQPEIVELYEMRVVLERTAAEFAARHATDAELDEMAELNESLLAAESSPVDAARLNAHFHRCIYMAGRNRFLLDSMRALNNARMLLGPTTLDDAARVRIVHTQHASIIAALRAQDPAVAGLAAVQHIETSLRHRLRSLRT